MPRIALTFDDGPNEPYTSRLAAILDEYSVRGTFFQVGCAIAREPGLTAQLAGSGHVIGNHSYRHRLRNCFTPRAIEYEIARTQDVAGEVLGHAPALFRPPWLVRNTATYAAARRHGLEVVLGTFCHPLEVLGIDAARTAGCAVRRAAPGRMIIFHDGYNGTGADRSRTVDAIRRTIETLAARGWQFATVPELLPPVTPRRPG